jgi:hydrogenase nickel incorporation protein HypA/HybF
MHEVSIATELVSTATAVARDHDAGRVDELTVEVGRATHVNPRQLKHTIEIVARDTMAADATVTVETVEPYATCDCGWQGRPETLESTPVVAPNVTCPDCGQRVTFREGRECRLASVSVPETDTHP